MSKREEALKRLRINEALEEDLAIANKRIAELEYVVSESIRLLELSEHPFYKGISILKDMQK